MRRKTRDDGSTELVPFEVELLTKVRELRVRGVGETHGTEVAQEMENDGGPDRRRLLGHGTIYRAFYRLVERGYLSSRLEPAELAEEHRRPRRRLYRLTTDGAAALETMAKTSANRLPDMLQEGAS
jgi:PadR family transcriptional regulator, regulatory protein PadR